MHRFAFAFAFALAACGELEPAEADAGPEVDAGIVEDTSRGACVMRCFEDDLRTDWQESAGAPDDRVTCCDCRRQLQAAEVADFCTDSVVGGFRVDNAEPLCPDCRDVP